MTAPPPPSATNVTVIGLGAMGRALATALLDSGHRVTVWNRTPGRADELAAAGATVAATPSDAFAASPLTIVCVLDATVVHKVLDDAGTQVAGSTVVNLTSSVPDDARALAARVTADGARYLDGKIMVPTPLIGTDDGFLIFSGDSTVFDDHEGTLRAFGSQIEHLGDDAGLASVHDLGMLDIFFNGMAAFLHAAALVGADGVTARSFLPHARRIVDVLGFTMTELADEVDEGRHPGDADNLEMESAALDHIVSTSGAHGIDTTVPATVRALVGAAIADGHGRDGFSRVIDVIRRAPA